MSKNICLAIVVFIGLYTLHTICISTVVIPAAGLGTRFLPFTKSIPKEMLPILSRPAIHYIVQEALRSNISTFCIITNPNKTALKHYLSPSPRLETTLRSVKKSQLLDDVNTLIHAAQFTYIHQVEPRGTGDAVLMAEKEIGNNFFGVLYPDDLIINEKPGLAQLIDIAQQYNASVIAVEEVPQEKISAYGVIAYTKEITPGIYDISHLVEKPEPKDAPSNLAIIGRYVLSPQIFNSIRAIAPHAIGEVGLTDAITHMLRSGERVLACKIEGQHFDLGTPPGWLKANIYLGADKK